ncbi:hypothetical protein NPA07_03215 [Mycoplasmopsis caviae]|uniref:Transposase n=1 Tax=Mycoplasmopsis caviae TaxID=55603 RepID=A0A3P8LBB8_9BACT|nr:hypothetical protein [Mycoplasmopsis caviae]UUD34806.1 hypothetical protein NPA07_03215 [Mycoplasmopsis caviae]VDR42341.1 Uncharacterised protein [Mycoplasmopsis caviae]
MEINYNDIDINNIFYESHIFYYEKARIANIKEEEFRTKLRFKLHPNWRISKHYIKKWFTPAGVFDLNVTTYELINKKGKRQRITYFHDDLVKGRIRYDKSIIKAFTRQFLRTGTVKEIESFNCTPKRQTVKMWIKKYGIDKQIFSKAEKEINEFFDNIIKQDIEEINIEMDDSYTKSQTNKQRKKVVATQYTIHPNSNKNSSLSDDCLTIIDIRNCPQNKDKNADTNRQIEFLKDFISPLKDANIDIHLIGDGAANIRQTSSKLNAKFRLDLFHLIKKINSTFGDYRYSPMANKLLFRTFKYSVNNRSWKNIFIELLDPKFGKNRSDFLKIKSDFWSEIVNFNVNNEVLKSIKNFFNYVERNKNGIWNEDGTLNNKKSYTEHFVYNAFKKYIKKPHSLYSIETMKLLVTYQNMRKGILTLLP